MALMLLLALFVAVGLAGAALHPLSLPESGQIGPVYWTYAPDVGYCDIWIDWSAN